MDYESDRPITSRELEDFKHFVDERFRSNRNQTLLYVGVAVGLIRFDLPDAVTAGAIFGMCLKGALAFIWRT